jgi:lipopolysaccharide biosynthesis protein
MTKIKPIAIYLPQFHPITENDEWWGKGFTEWNNVVKSKPRFENHYQPHLPADMGFYDLRLEESRIAQEKLAKEYGIYGFCYYHYWFNRKRILDEPLERKLKNPKEDFPFMLCWANENWTRAWDGGESEVLLKQEYSENDDRLHITELMRYFKDERYIRVNGKPFFAFYKPDLFPNIKRTLEIFREEALKEGIELYLTWFERWIGWQGEGHEESGFDAAIEFQPLSKPMKTFLDKNKIVANTEKEYKIKKLIGSAINRITPTKKEINNLERIIHYPDFVEYDLNYPKRNYKCYPGVCPMWDNSSRRVGQLATILVDSTPELFGRWYKQKVENFLLYSTDENFIFINAWNEWAEGNHLEPCQKWGKQYLEALL